MNKILCLLLLGSSLSANKKHTDHLPKHLDLNDQIYRQVVVDQPTRPVSWSPNHMSS